MDIFEYCVFFTDQRGVPVDDNLLYHLNEFEEKTVTILLIVELLLCF